MHKPYTMEHFVKQLEFHYSETWKTQKLGLIKAQLLLLLLADAEGTPVLSLSTRSQPATIHNSELMK